MIRLLLPFLLLWPALAWGTPVTGRVVSDGDPVAGMTVTAYRDLDPSGAPLARSQPTGADGLYRLELPAGNYALYARNAAGDRFAFCGRSPVVVAKAQVWAGLQAVTVTPAKTSAYDDPYSSAIVGRVLENGQPLAGAYVSLYLDVREDLKGQGYRMSPPTAADGSFAFDGLPESNYFLAVRKRADGGRVGPIREGDYLGVYPGNPIALKAGEVSRVELPVVRKAKESQASETFGRGGGPVLRGVVRDASGRPVAGVHVFAYTSRVIGHQRPAALSPPTGADGAFAVNLPASGTYYLGARQNYGDSPAPGELFGMYEGSADHGLAVAADSPPPLTITVEPIALQ